MGGGAGKYSANSSFRNLKYTEINTRREVNIFKLYIYNNTLIIM